MANILLAEDDDSMRVFLAKALERAGHSVASYGQGDEALGELDQQSFDLLLTDIVMPVMDGIELARRASARYQRQSHVPENDAPNISSPVLHLHSKFSLRLPAPKLKK